MAALLLNCLNCDEMRWVNGMEFLMKDEMEEVNIFDVGRMDGSKMSEMKKVAFLRDERTVHL